METLMVPSQALEQLPQVEPHSTQCSEAIDGRLLQTRSNPKPSLFIVSECSLYTGSSTSGWFASAVSLH